MSKVIYYHIIRQSEFKKCMPKEGRIKYYIVHQEQSPKFTRIVATYRHHNIELIYELKEHQGELFWFGKIYIDGKLYWSSPESFGCDTREILNDEIQHRLYTWALKQGYISHHKIAP